MAEVCPNCGLPKELCVCETIAKESQKIIVTTEKKAFGKLNTVITGIDEKEINLRDLAKKLKTEFACGGTAKEGKIELQGDHKQKIKESLVRFGFAPETIEIR
jgi:translation initiation factor 1